MNGGWDPFHPGEHEKNIIQLTDLSSIRGENRIRYEMDPLPGWWFGCHFLFSH